MKKLKEAYIGYIDTDNTPRGIKVKVLKPGMDPSNAYKLDYIFYIANTLNFIMGRIMYFSERNNKAVSEVIITDKMLAKNIGCHKNHSSRVLTQLSEIFGLKFERQHFTGGARTVKINRTLIDFMMIYSEAELYGFIQKHNIPEKHFRALMNIYKYRVFGVKPSSNQMKPSQEKAQQEFVKENREFYHFVSTSNKSDHARIEYVKNNQNKLGSYQHKQLARIQEEKKNGRLGNYWFRLLIRLEQFISNVLRREKQASETTEEETPSQFNGNTTDGMSTAHESATHEQQKEPESVDPGTIIKILVAWNNMIGTDGTIKPIEKLTDNLIKSINANVKSNTIERVIHAIQKVPGLKHDTSYEYKMTFDRFIKNPEHVNKIISLPFTVEHEPEWIHDYMEEAFGCELHSRTIKEKDIPTYETIEEVQSWWNNKQN